MDLKGKRKKKNPCPNPLFVKWLTQWRDDAAERGIKSSYTYNKALTSLKKYPLVFNSGKECKVLENVGDKICKMLDTKLEEHISLYGRVAAIPVEDISEGGPPPRKYLKPDVRKPDTKAIIPPVAPLSLHVSDVHSISDDESPPSVKKRRSHSGEYVPAYRSGPYAILLTLYKNFQRANSVGQMSKDGLMRDAQSLCDASFRVPDPGSRYTAWSSMGTLIRKGLVIKDGSPARYSLTEAGCDLSDKLVRARTPDISSKDSVCGGESTTLSNLPHLPVLESLPRNHTDHTISSIDSSNIRDEGSLSQTQTDRFTFWYITEEGMQTVDKNKAAVMVDDSIGLGFLIKCNYQALLKSGKTYKLDISRPLGDKDMFAYLKDYDADEVACAPDKPHTTERHTISSVQKHTVQSASSHVSEKIALPRPVAQPSLPSLTVPVPGYSGQPLSERLGFKQKSAVPATTCSILTPAEKPSTSTSSNSTPLFTFKPGTFEIVLCVDNQEFYGKTSSGGKTLFSDLIKNGVTCDLRKLQVGDFLWVAREKVTAPTGGQLRLPEARELVLDHIIERKRMDDLVGSCIDGRYKEQKFRLKQCGLRCPIYLIEDYGSCQNFSMPEDRLKQTIANTQVVDGFMVKRTRDNLESVAYLTIVTRYLQSFYQRKTLHCYPSDVLADISGPLNIHAVEQKLLEFKQFNEASVKTKNLSIREMFGKQIIQMYRLSADGARAVLNHYPTPSHLCSAYDACHSEKEKEDLLSKIKSGKAGRSLGAASSRQFYQLYCTNKPLV